MNGQPVWLASISKWETLPTRKSPGPILENEALAKLMGLNTYALEQARMKPKPTYRYDDNERKQAENMLMRVLRSVGNRGHERFFRMNLTYCMHRALSPEEVATLPPRFFEGKARDIAGGPVEILWSRGIAPGAISADPCLDPGKEYISPEIWLPIDCGECAPCKARKWVLETGLPCNSETYCPSP